MRNYISIDDVCRAFLHVIDSNIKNNVFNVGNDEINMSKLQLCQKVKEHLPLEIIKANYTSDPDQRNYIVSSKKFYDTGFSCKYNLDDGIRNLIKVYKMIDTTKYANY
jgi:nucleoside-diphosphate-sugar epimerase